MKVIGNYLATDAGKPIFLVGSYDYSPIHLGIAFWTPWLNSMTGKANYVRVGLSGIDSATNLNPYQRVPGHGKTSGGYGNKFDLTLFNQTFFNQFRKFLTLANTNGVIVHVSLFNEIFVKLKAGCGFARNPFGNGNHINQALVGDVDRNHDGDGTDYNEFYDLEALQGKTKDKQRLAVAKLQKDFVTKIVGIGKAFPNVFYEVGNEVSNMNWTQYWVSFLAGQTAAPVTVNSPSMSYKAASPTKGLTYHRIDYNFAAGQGVVRGLDSDGAGIDEASVDVNRDIAWTSLTSGFGLYGNYVEKIIRIPIPTGFKFSNDKRLLDQYFYDGHLQDILTQTNAHLGIMKPHPELVGGKSCIANPGKQYLIYPRTATTLMVNLKAYTGKFRFRVYNSLAQVVLDKLMDAGTVPITVAAGNVVFVNKV